MVLLLTLTTLQARAQTFALRQATDTTAVLTLTTDSTADYCRIPYRTYRFCTGDIDGDGRAEAMVGVIKRTRFDKEMGRRLFIYKNLGGRIRPLWMGKYEASRPTGAVFTMWLSINGISSDSISNGSSSKRLAAKKA